MNAGEWQRRCICPKRNNQRIRLLYVTISNRQLMTGLRWRIGCLRDKLSSRWLLFPRFAADGGVLRSLTYFRLACSFITLVPSVVTGRPQLRLGHHCSRSGVIEALLYMHCTRTRSVGNNPGITSLVHSSTLIIHLDAPYFHSWIRIFVKRAVPCFW